jgi:formyltetrahydrofolate synthetase
MLLLLDLSYYELYASCSRFASDTEAELRLVQDLCLEGGAFSAAIANHWAEGGAGATELGLAVIAACEQARATEAASSASSFR